MSEKRSSGGPNVGLLLLIPAAALVAKAAKRHHSSRWDGGGLGPRAHRSHSLDRCAGPDSDTAARDALRLPPRIEAILGAWHTRAHEAAAPTDGPAS